MPSNKTCLKCSSKENAYHRYKVKSKKLSFLLFTNQTKGLESCPSKQIFVVLRLGFKTKEQDGDDNKKIGEQDQQWHGMAYMDLKYGIRISLLGNITPNPTRKKALIKD